MPHLKTDLEILHEELMAGCWQGTSFARALSKAIARSALGRASKRKESEVGVLVKPNVPEQAAAWTAVFDLLCKHNADIFGREDNYRSGMETALAEIRRLQALDLDTGGVDIKGHIRDLLYAYKFYKREAVKYARYKGGRQMYSGNIGNEAVAALSELIK
jgi:hypothetical protein